MTRSRIRGAMALAAPLALLLLAACSPQDRQNAMYPSTEYGRFAINLFEQITWLALGVFVVVEMALVWILWRYRARRGDLMPRQLHGNQTLEIAWTIIPAVILAFMAVPTVGGIFYSYEQPSGANVVNVTTTGWRYWWAYEYPDLGITTASDMVVPVGKTVLLKMRAGDVIHSHWIPGLGVKRDAVPGHENTVWFTAEKPGIYLGQCTEYCGTAHAQMKMRVIVKTQEDFDAWVRDTKAPARAQPTDVGARLFLQKQCNGCHYVEGLGERPRTPSAPAPVLTHFGSRTTIAGGIYENTEENLRKWLFDPALAKEGALMPRFPMTDAEMDTMVAFLRSLR